MSRTEPRINPHNQDAEKNLLGAMLIDRKALDIALEYRLTADDFYMRQCAIVYRHILQLDEAGEMINVITLIDALKRSKELDKIGGAYFITGLAESMPTAAQAASYVRIIKDKSSKRKLIDIANDILQKAFDDSVPAVDLLQDAEQNIFDLAEVDVRKQFIHYNDLVTSVLEDLDRLHSGEKASGAIQTGFADLDRLLVSLNPGDLVVLAGRPSMGKTALALDIAKHVSKHVPVAFFTLEMSDIQLSNRILLSEARVDSIEARHGKLNKEDFRRVMKVAARKFDIYIEENMQLTVMEMVAKARRIKAEKNIGLIIIDYLQLINPGKSFPSENAELTYISRTLKLMAKNVGVPVIILSQLSRAVEMRSNHRPRMSDLRGSGSIEQDADVVLFVYREEKYLEEKEIALRQADGDDPTGVAEIIVGKQRSGPLGTVSMAFIEQYTRFENLAQSMNEY